MRRRGQTTSVLLARALARATGEASQFEALRLVEAVKIDGRLDDCAYEALRIFHKRRWHELVRGGFEKHENPHGSG